ncbi:MAG TPA: helix-turn-helix transcriptional regulator [Cyclobacteriaceae bacterium]|nr:helix-turn-helix transcriptional regulator [Cyclobacteriaceae bacterium]
MTHTDSIQSGFLEQIKSKLAPNLSFVDELAELLSISRDSAYRRIRGETVLSLDEIRLLTSRYGISLDDFLSPSNDRVSFQLKALDVADFSFEKWFKSILDNLELFLAYPETDKRMTFDAKDLPIFYYFQFPRLAAFKIYFWMKTFAQDIKLTAGKYDSKMVDNRLIAMANKIWDRYSKIPCTEIITYELLNVTLRQIEYAYDCGMFTHKEEALTLCDDCSLLSNHLQRQAELGNKITYGQDEPGASFKIYVNEVLIGSNSILFEMGPKRIAFITPNNFNLLMTTHEAFCQITLNHINNLIDKSVLITASAKRQRSKFFNRIEETIQGVKSRLV